jgi:hypothetical protein
MSQQCRPIAHLFSSRRLHRLQKGLLKAVCRILRIAHQSVGGRPHECAMLLDDDLPIRHLHVACTKIARHRNSRNGRCSITWDFRMPCNPRLSGNAFPAHTTPVLTRCYECRNMAAAPRRQHSVVPIIRTNRTCDVCYFPPEPPKKRWCGGCAGDVTCPPRKSLPSRMSIYSYPTASSNSP